MCGVRVKGEEAIQGGELHQRLYKSICFRCRHMGNEIKKKERERMHTPPPHSTQDRKTQKNWYKKKMGGFLGGFRVSFFFVRLKTPLIHP